MFDVTADRKQYMHVHQLHEENKILRKNIADLQEQVQKAYIRIKELTANTNQMELDFKEFYEERKWKK